MKTLKRTIAAGLAALALSATAVSAQVVTIATGAQGSLAYNSDQAVAKVASSAEVA